MNNWLHTQLRRGIFLALITTPLHSAQSTSYIKDLTTLDCHDETIQRDLIWGLSEDEKKIIRPEIDGTPNVGTLVLSDLDDTLIKPADPLYIPQHRDKRAKLQKAMNCKQKTIFEQGWELSEPTYRGANRLISLLMARYDSAYGITARSHTQNTKTLTHKSLEKVGISFSKKHIIDQPGFHLDNGVFFCGADKTQEETARRKAQTVTAYLHYAKTKEDKTFDRVIVFEDQRPNLEAIQEELTKKHPAIQFCGYLVKTTQPDSSLERSETLKKIEAIQPINLSEKSNCKRKRSD